MSHRRVIANAQRDSLARLKVGPCRITGEQKLPVVQRRHRSSGDFGKTRHSLELELLGPSVAMFNPQHSRQCRLVSGQSVFGTVCR